MSSTGNGEPAGRQDLLADVLAGTRAPDDSEVRAACQDPSFARLLGELQDLQGRVDRGLDAEREALAAPPSAIDARIHAAVQAALPARERSGRLLRGPWRVLLLVAAALLVGAGAVLLWPRTPPQDYRLAGDFRIEVAPDYAEVRWQGAAGALRFRVRVLDLDGAEIDRSDQLQTNTWSPREAARWPDRVVVRVELVDVGDQTLRAGTVEVDRSGTRR